MEKVYFQLVSKLPEPYYWRTRPADRCKLDKTLLKSVSIWLRSIVILRNPATKHPMGLLVSVDKGSLHILHWRDLSKIFGGKPKYWGQRLVISDKSIGVSQLLGDT